MSPAARVVVVLFAGVFHVAAGTVPWNLPVLAEDAPVEQVKNSPISLPAPQHCCLVCACAVRTPAAAATVCAPLTVCWQRGCSAVLDEYYKYQPTGKPPPREMPEQLVDGYTWNGRIPIGDFFVDDTNGGRGSEYGAPNDYVCCNTNRVCLHTRRRQTLRPWSHNVLPPPHHQVTAICQPPFVPLYSTANFSPFLPADGQ